MPPPSLFVFSFLLFLLPLLFLLILVFCLRFLSLIVVCFFFFFSDSVSSFSSFYLHPLFSFFFLLSPPLCYVHCPWLSRSAFVCRCVFVRPSLFISVSVSVFFFFLFPSLGPSPLPSVSSDARTWLSSRRFPFLFCHRLASLPSLSALSGHSMVCHLCPDVSILYDHRLSGRQHLLCFFFSFPSFFSSSSSSSLSSLSIVCSFVGRHCSAAIGALLQLSLFGRFVPVSLTVVVGRPCLQLSLFGRFVRLACSVVPSSFRSFLSFVRLSGPFWSLLCHCADRYHSGCLSISATVPSSSVFITVLRSVVGFPVVSIAIRPSLELFGLVRRLSIQPCFRFCCRLCRFVIVQPRPSLARSAHNLAAALRPLFDCCVGFRVAIRRHCPASAV